MGIEAMPKNRKWYWVYILGIEAMLKNGNRGHAQKQKIILRIYIYTGNRGHTQMTGHFWEVDIEENDHAM